MNRVRLLVCGISLLLSVAFLGTACRPPTQTMSSAQPAGPPWFVDVTAESGLDFVHDVGSTPLDHYFLPQLLGSGAAFFDFDRNGRLDLYLIQNGGPNSAATNRLYRQGKDGRFVDVSKGSGLDISGHGMGVAIGDVNNDGWPDVLVTEYCGIRLFLNNGNGTFTEITKEAGLDHPLWATSACFVDYDRDGWLDLVVTNYLDYDPTRVCSNAETRPRDYCSPKNFAGTVTKLYRNLGPPAGQQSKTVRFADVTLKSGLGQLAGPGLGVVCADFNGDGWPDILVANDAHPNRLWINQHDGTFKDEAALRGIAYNALGQAPGNMGIALGDVDGDGLFDIYVTHLTEEIHNLWQQGPRGFFQDQTAAAGLAPMHGRGTGFGTVLVDFDHDGALDIAVVNGRVSRGLVPPAASPDSFWTPYAERNQLFANDGSGRFRDIAADNPPFCGKANVARGLAYGDVNGDGAIDLLVTSVAGPARLYRNVAPNRGHWLLVRVLDPAVGGRDAYGAEITVQAGGRRWTQWANPGSSYLCSNDPRVHFGLGKAERVDRITVLWPDGTREAFPGQPVDRIVELHKRSGKKQ
jgi:enediyne biosynthesis protein E4